jgi:hypothetical protein
MFKQFAVTAALVAGGLFAHTAQAAPIVRLSTAAPTVTVGSNFTVSLSIEGVVDLFGWDADLSHTPAERAEVLGQAAGSFFGGGDSFFAGSVDAPSGTIAYIGSALSGLVGADGSGVLAELTFKALTEGALSFAFDRMSLIDSLGNDIFLATEERFGTTIRVLAGNNVPLPGSLALAVLALGLLPVAARRTLRQG